MKQLPLFAHDLEVRTTADVARVPVDQPLAAVIQALLIQLNESVSRPDGRSFSSIVKYSLRPVDARSP